MNLDIEFRRERKERDLEGFRFLVLMTKRVERDLEGEYGLILLRIQYFLK